MSMIQIFDFFQFIKQQNKKYNIIFNYQLYIFYLTMIMRLFEIKIKYRF